MSWDPSPRLSALDRGNGDCCQSSGRSRGPFVSPGWQESHDLMLHSPGQRKPRAQVREERLTEPLPGRKGPPSICLSSPSFGAALPVMRPTATPSARWANHFASFMRNKFHQETKARTPKPYKQKACVSTYIKTEATCFLIFISIITLLLQKSAALPPLWF